MARPEFVVALVEFGLGEVEGVLEGGFGGGITDAFEVEQGRAIVGGGSGEGFALFVGEVGGEAANEGDGAVGLFPVGAALTADPVAEDGEVGGVLHLGGDNDFEVGVAGGGEEEAVAGGIAGEGAGEGGEAGFAVGEEAAVGIAEADGVGFGPSGRAGGDDAVPFVGDAGLEGLDAKLDVVVDDFLAVFKEVWHGDAHGSELVGVAAGGVEGGGDGDFGLGIGR